MFHIDLSKQVYRTAFSIVIAFALLITMAPVTSHAAPVAAQNMAPAASGQIYYTVRPGDTLSKIAVRFGTTVQALMRANGLYNPNVVYVGQVLVIPAAAGGCVRYHRVTYGDTLSNIALRYGVSVNALARANKIYNWNRIYRGQVLCIPGGVPVGPVVPGKGAGFWYTVRYGDTLSKIAYRYGTTVYRIMAANGLRDPNHIYVWQRLWIPGAAPIPPVPPVPPVPPAPAGSWTGLYYNNKDFSGSPTLVRQDPAVKFDWGTGSPAAQIPADNFSVLWTRTFYFSGGTYRFMATTDDGVRVYVDDQLVIDAWRVQPATNYFGDMTLGPGNHTIRVEYFEASGFASIYVRWVRL